MPRPRKTRQCSPGSVIYGGNNNNEMELALPSSSKGYTFTTLPFDKYFNGSPERNWDSWLKKFNRYRLISKLINEQCDVQVSVLLLSIGDEADDIYDSFNLKNPLYDDVIKHFTSFFAKSVNVIYERAKFNKRLQLENEPAEDFILSLYALVKTCNYGSLKDELLRDKLVVGVRDEQLSQSLQMDPCLTLQTAIDKIKLHESVKKHQPIVRMPTSSDPIDTLAVTKMSWPNHKNNKNTSKNSKFVCYRCGGESYHKYDECKAKNVKCGFCKIFGHFESCCNKKRDMKNNKVVLELEQRESIETNSFFFRNSGSSDSSDYWKI